MADKKKQQNKLIAALAVGTAIGAGIALLFSPKRGREFRAQLREGGISLKEFAQQQVGQDKQKKHIFEEPKLSLSAKAKHADYDVIVVGGGHNGLVAAGYLAKAGRKVLLLEKKEMVGGTAVTETFFPDYHFSSIADGAGYMSPDVVKDLNLTQHGLHILPVESLVFAPQPDGTQLTIWQDIDRTVDEIAKFSEADTAAYPKFVEMMRKFSQVVSGLKNMTPPDLPDVGLSDMMELLNIANPVRGLGRKNIAQVLRVMPMPIADLLNEWFESDVVKGAIAASALNDISWGPREAGTAYTFLYNWSGSNVDLFRACGQIKGGMGALTQALSTAVKHFGAEILTNSEVTNINQGAGQVTGVTLANGDQITAAVVVSATNMRTTFLKLVDPYYLDHQFVRHVQNIKYRGTTARVHFTLNKLPNFTAASDNTSSQLGGHIQIAPTMTYLQKAFDPVKYGRISERPYLDIQIPTLTDDTLAPAGKHIMSVTVKYMPYHLREGNWEELRETIGQLVKGTLAEYAPDFDQCVQHCHVITALDMETDYDLPEGNPVQGEMTLDQFLWMRPIPGYGQYRTPLENLYLCSSATHPGGGITGINGKNAAREILKDWK